MDLAQFNTVAGGDEGSWLHLETPAGEKLYADDPVHENGETIPPKLPMRIKLHGGDSDRARKVRHRIQNNRIRKIGRRGRMGSVSSEKQDEDGTELLAQLTIEWENIKISGEIIPFDLEAARNLYHSMPWIRDQVDEHVDDRANFLGEA